MQWNSSTVRRGVGLGLCPCANRIAIGQLQRNWVNSMSVAPSRHALTFPATPLVASPSAGVPLLDVQRQYQAIRREIVQAIERVCDSGRFVLGPDCEQLEQSLAGYCQVPHAIACASEQVF